MNQLRDRVCKTIAFGVIGDATPVMQGTVGTLFAVVYWQPIRLLPPTILVLFLIAMFVLGCYVCGLTAKLIDNPDPKSVIFDEIVGYFIAMAFIPLSLTTLISGFLLFRFLDIIKPWPISLADRKIKGGFGIMFDDALAGIATNLVLQGLIFYGLIVV